MTDRVTGGRGHEPGYSGHGLQGSTVHPMLNMVKNRNPKGLEAALRREKTAQEDLHAILFAACCNDAAAIVEIAERLLSQAVELCRSANAMDLEGQFEALANDCLSLPGKERPRIVLEVIGEIVRNDDELVQGKAIPSLQVMLDSLPGEARAASSFQSCHRLNSFT